ncbi:hypothetical protein [Microcoleus sp. B3-A4]
MAKIRSLGCGAPDIMFVELPAITLRKARSQPTAYADPSLGITRSF